MKEHRAKLLAQLLTIYSVHKFTYLSMEKLNTQAKKSDGVWFPYLGAIFHLEEPSGARHLLLQLEHIVFRTCVVTERLTAAGGRCSRAFLI